MRTGSLELLGGANVDTLFGDGSEAVAAYGEGRGGLSVDNDSCDLVIMNPPFTAPTNHTREERQKEPFPQFAAFGMDKKTQKKIDSRVRGMLRKVKPRASDGQAGLSTTFFDLAHKKLKPGGVVAFITPATFASGASYKNFRNILDSEYENVTVITCSSGNKEHRRFSSDTDKAECLIVATRRAAPHPTGGGEDWKWVNLDRNPKTVAEAVVIAWNISGGGKSGDKIVAGKVGDAAWGFSISMGMHGAPTALRSPDVLKSMLALTDADRPHLVIPRSNRVLELPLTRLYNLGTRGRLSRDLASTAITGTRGPFRLLPHPGGKTDFPGIWNHHTRHKGWETRLVVQPDVYGQPVKGKEQLAAERWKTATRLHFNCEFRLTSQSLAACLTPEPALGGSAWPSFTLHGKGEEVVERMDWAYPVLLWSNTTLGLISRYAPGNRADPGRSRLSISLLPDLLVLDPRTLTSAQLAAAENIFGEFEAREFLPARKAAWDETRRDLDEAVLTRLLGFGGDVLERVEVIRDQWCHEPHLTGAD